MVNFAIRNDPHARLRFVASQTEKGQELIARLGIDQGLDTVILVEGDKWFAHSTAAIRIAKYLKAPASWLYAFMIVPKFIRDPFYKWFSRNRYKWFGKRESCMVPAAGVRERFL
jgi:predicted DCC family thiol-disulfide oxidoreductase YuxK